MRSIALGMSIAAVGELLRIWAAGHLNKSREVTASGPYRWVAHPLYLGSSIMGAGLAVACANALVAGLIALYLALTLSAAMRSEAPPGCDGGWTKGEVEEFRDGVKRQARENRAG